MITQELKDTLIAFPHIQNVFFEASGGWYFNVKTFEGEQYGRLVHTAIPYHTQGTRVLYRSGSMPDMPTKIVKQMSRSEILGVAKKEK